MSDYNDGLIPEPCLRLDYGFGQQYASVELGDGTGYVRVTDELRSEYHKMERWYDDELRAALDENAKLRDELANAPKCEACEAMLDCDECLRADGSHKERRRLSAENAKLRELVADLIKWCEGPCCGCIDYESCDGTPIYEFWSVTKDRASELGVEVEA